MSAAAASAAARAAVGLAGGVLVAFSVALVGADLRRVDSVVSTYAEASTAFAVLGVTVGVALLVASLLLLTQRTTSAAGVFALAATAAWVAPAWVGWDGGPEVVRSLGLVVAPLLPAAVLLTVAVAWPRGSGLGRLIRLSLAALVAAATLAAAIALALVRDPLRDPDCWSDCTVNALVVHDDVELAKELTSIVLALGVAAGALATVMALVRLARASAVTRRAAGPAFTAAAVAGLALGAYPLALVLEPQEDATSGLYGTLFVARAIALLALAAGLAWLAVRPLLVRGLVTRLAIDLGRSAEGGLVSVLSRALGDSDLRLAYPLGENGRLVDGEGRPVVPRPGKRMTPIVGRDDGVVAVIESDGLSVDALEVALGPAAQLALGNERLRAEALERLAAASAARARVVATADAARQRMERDLHDAAQQRMLALTYDLRVAVDLAQAVGDEAAFGRLGAAHERAVVASRELRDIAHGIFPAELTASGLEAALESLADIRPLRLAVDLPPGRRYRAEVEAAAYAVIVEALDAAEAAGGPVAVQVGELDRTIRLSVDGVAEWGDRLVHVEDRVRAAGGGVNVEGTTLVAHLAV